MKNLRVEDTSSGKKIIRNTKTGELDGSLVVGGKITPTSATNLKKLSEEVADAQSMAIESNQPEAYEYYYTKRDRYEAGLAAFAKIASDTNLTGL